MPQIFHPSANTLSRVSLFGSALLLVGIAVAIAVLTRSPYVTQADVAREQPVPFSHEHHVGGLGIDCRYCHSSVERSAFAGMPSTETCMTCHSKIWTEASMLEPIRASYRSGAAIEWVRVNDLPDFVYFDHSIHLHKGIGCESCHGRVDRMPLTWRAASLSMGWCLDCHRDPGPFLRSRDQLFAMDAASPSLAGAATPVETHRVVPRTDCYACHR